MIFKVDFINGRRKIIICSHCNNKDKVKEAIDKLLPNYELKNEEM
ncbi:hypothetical protein [Clostridium sp. LY3-2]|nr:hypothetical protein [Clostridium sp. LY3-2]